jgi:hypothetical protein
MRIFWCVVFCLLGIGRAFSDTPELIGQLKSEIGRKAEYDNAKEKKLHQLKARLVATPISKHNVQFALCSQIYDEYRSYQYDSASVYADRMLVFANKMNSKPRQDYTKVQMAFILLSSGMFKETFDNLKGVDPRLLSDSARFDLYSVLTRAYYDIAQYDNDSNYAPRYNALANQYIDSALALTAAGSYDNTYLTGYKLMKNRAYDQAEIIFKRQLKDNKLTRHQYAIVASTLSDLYISTNRNDLSIDLLIQAAIADIQSSTKETVALFWLSQQLYKKGDSRNAYQFIQQAMADAEFYGARQRQFQISSLLPIVAAQELDASEKARMRFLLYTVATTLIAGLVVVFSFLLYKQLKKVQAKEKEIEEKNEELEIINGKLQEDARIKEDYIGYFFNAISGYILKLEKLKHSIDTKLSIKKYEDIQIAINKINIKKEREDLFYTFDHVFLKIFPNFISSFNALFAEKDQIWPKEHEVLTTDLRIFALMRLGISDTAAIANILEYSEKTIYVYKMRMKAKALIHGDEFDAKIMAIKAVDTVKE